MSVLLLELFLWLCFFFLLGTGCIVKAVAYAAQREPVILGKPNKLLFDIAKTV